MQVLAYVGSFEKSMLKPVFIRIYRPMSWSYSHGWRLTKTYENLCSGCFASNYSELTPRVLELGWPSAARGIDVIYLDMELWLR